MLSRLLCTYFCEGVQFNWFSIVNIPLYQNPNIIEVMHGEFSSSSPYLDKYHLRQDIKRPLSTYFNSPTHNQKPSAGKSLRWNIEESKQNFKDDHKAAFTSCLSALQPTTTNLYSSKPITAKKTWDSPQLQSKKNASKSYKTITFSNDLEKEYEKEKITVQKCQDYFKQRDNSKWLTMSLGYKTTVNDLIGHSSTLDHLNSKVDKSYGHREQPEQRKMKSSKSQKKIRYQIQDNYTPPMKHQFSKNQYVLECTEKSSKKIIDKAIIDKDKEEKPIISYPSKSSKSIKQEFIRPKMEKTVSCNEHLDAEPLDKLYAKKHQTVEAGRNYHHIEHASHSTSSYHHLEHPTLSTSPSTCSSQGKHKLSLSDFQVGKCKGEGAFGQVFLAIHKATRMLVALKKVPKEKVKYMLEQFINEIKIQMFLDHPNIVKLFGFFDDPTNFYIVMEYMDGGNLFALIKKKKKLTEAETIQKLKEVCLGLKEMHDNSILHRDIKPENIVMTNDVSKLCDFGWAAICKDRRTTYCGTLDYVSPQIIQGQGYDDSVDIWCIGVLAFELICGRTPFYNISRKQTMKRIRDVHYDYPCQISSLAKSFIDGILKKNPDQRIGIDEVLKHKFLNQ